MNTWYRRPWFHRDEYVPRYRGYYLLRYSVEALGAVLSLVTSHFGYTCDVFYNFCEDNLRADLLRKKGAKKR